MNAQNPNMKPAAKRRSLVLCALEDDAAAASSSSSSSKHSSSNQNDRRHAQEQQKQQRRRILLAGPPKSGRTSLAMDVAYQIASSSQVPERCRGACRLAHAVTTPTTSTTASTRVTIGEDSGTYFCKCVAVALFLVRDRVDCGTTTTNTTSNNNNKDKLPFPLPCYEQAMSQGVTSISSDANMSEYPAVWRPDSLGRIQVHHICSFGEILEYLWNIQAKPLHQQPWGGIVVDDLDRLILRSLSSPPQHDSQQQNQLRLQDGRDSTTGLAKPTQNPSLVMMQLLAVLEDTIDTIRSRCILHDRRLSGDIGLNPYLLVTMSEQSYRQYWAAALSNWIPTHFVVKRQPLAPADGIKSSERDTADDSWTLERMRHDEESGNGFPLVQIHYNIVLGQVRNGVEACIMWERRLGTHVIGSGTDSQ